MKSFDQYMIIRSLAETIVHYNVDVDHICESILSNIEENGIDNLDEGIMDGFSRAVGGIARGVSGVAGMPFGMAKDAAGAVGGMFKKAGQYVSDKYAAGAKAQAAKQVEDRLKGLADAMAALGISQQDVNSTLKMVQKVVAAGGVKPEMTRAGASRQGRQAAFDRMRSMRDQAQKTQTQKTQAQPQVQNPWASGMSKMQQQKPADPYSAFRAQAS